MKASGIVGNEIPGSVRPDGTVRKAIKVKPGFIPVEDQAKFVSGRIQEKKPIPGQVVGRATIKPEEKEVAPKSKSAKKNEKRKEKKLVVQAETDSAVTAEKPTQPESVASESASIPIEKKVKAVKKKLRQITELRQKQADGVELIQDQLDKLSLESQLQDELQELENSLKSE
ncbi:hypothetical protein BC833DRAFT_625813 [Globomyces pollinis-pini]|nr:hypothetical protein BC833DRAFT_625813 [Globomyces pollinis-pini]